MPRFLISREWLRPGEQALAEPAAAAPGASERPRAYTGRWVAEGGERELGEPFVIEVPAATAEAFGPAGAIAHVELEPDLAFSVEPPGDAAELRISDGAALLAQVPIAAAKAPLPMPAVRPIRFGPAGARFVYPVFAERFGTEESFRSAVAALYDWIVGVAPFNEPGVRAAFAIDGYFWPTVAPSGHFRTPDVPYDCKHPPDHAVTFLGNNDVARSRIGHLLLDGKFGLVLINSRVRGGAGGMPDSHYPAWGSITACPGEVWQAVVLHEIGHSLGLADEYPDAARSGEAPRGEPNVSAGRDFAGLDWKDLLTEKPPTANSYYSLERQNGLTAASMPAADFVGVFQGARYRSDLYRPSWLCLMRYTTVTRFCPVCARRIRQRVHG
jgi:IgA Peptidase M64